MAVFLIVDAGLASDYWFGGPDTLELSEEDRELINEFVEKIAKSEELKKSNRNFFNIICNGKAVKSVGICEAPGVLPAFSIPSDQFGERSGLCELDSDPNERPQERVSDVILETADLSDKDRKWRFHDVTTGKPFTAKMRDIDENLRMGIKMQRKSEMHKLEPTIG